MMTRGRLTLLGLLVWALLMIVPDLARVVRPLSSLGFYADSNGLIYDITGPFNAETDSPAWLAGIREGDRLDFSRMRCLPYDEVTCASTLAAAGGNLFVAPGRTAVIDLVQSEQQPAREVTLVAKPRPANWLVRIILLLDQITGIAVVLAAAWLVWVRPGPMSWGFFLYVLWFNPGQSFEFYAQLQRWPPLLLAQYVAGSLAQAAGYGGLLLFVMRAPTGVQQPAWATFERALPYAAGVVALAVMACYGNAFGFGTELLTRIVILIGLAVSGCAVAIVILRRQTLTPKDNQRLRWVLWGCLIGLPAFVLADLSEYTSLFATSWTGIAIPEDVAGLLYLVNGIFCLFVFEALRRTRVINVSIPLRRATVLALTLSVPALLLHREAEHLQETLDVPQWSWFLIGAIVVFAIGRLHHIAVEVTERYFNRQLERAEAELGEAILKAEDPEAIDRLLSEAASRALKLESAATFRGRETGFHRYENGAGWNDGAVRDLRLDAAIATALTDGEERSLDEAAARLAGLPSGLEGPILAVPAASRAHCYAVTLYGPHESGTAIDHDERHVLGSLGGHAADAYARLENEALRRRVKLLESQLLAGVPSA